MLWSHPDVARAFDDVNATTLTTFRLASRAASELRRRTLEGGSGRNAPWFALLDEKIQQAASKFLGVDRSLNESSPRRIVALRRNSTHHQVLGYDGAFEAKALLEWSLALVPPPKAEDSLDLEEPVIANNVSSLCTPTPHASSSRGQRFPVRCSWWPSRSRSRCAH